MTDKPIEVQPGDRVLVKNHELIRRRGSSDEWRRGRATVTWEAVVAVRPLDPGDELSELFVVEVTGGCGGGTWYVDPESVLRIAPAGEDDVEWEAYREAWQARLDAEYEVAEAKRREGADLLADFLRWLAPDGVLPDYGRTHAQLVDDYLKARGGSDD